MSVRALCTQPPRDLSCLFVRGAVSPRRCPRTVWTPSSQPDQQTSNSCKPPSPEQNNSRADTHARAPLSPATAPCNLSSCIFLSGAGWPPRSLCKALEAKPWQKARERRETARNRHRFPFTTLHILPKPSLRSGPALTPCPLCTGFSQLTSLGHGPSSQPFSFPSVLASPLVAQPDFPQYKGTACPFPFFQMFKSGVLSRSLRGPTRSSGHAGGAGDTCRGEQKGSQRYGLEGSRSTNL